MEKKKRKRMRRILGLTVGELCAFVTILGSIIGGCIGGALYLDERFDGITKRFEDIDKRFERVDSRFEAIENRLDKIEMDISKTSNLLDAYLTWRFIYVPDPGRKDLVPRYDPRSRTIEFIDKKELGRRTNGK